MTAPPPGSNSKNASLEASVANDDGNCSLGLFVNGFGLSAPSAGVQARPPPAAWKTIYRPSGLQIGSVFTPGPAVNLVLAPLSESYTQTDASDPSITDTASLPPSGDTRGIW